VAAERELTARALATGALLGALFAPCNIYSGLKIGWSFNMSIAALLAGLAFWRAAERAARVPGWQLKESNISQTTASSAASIVSGGLVAPIPAYTLLTGFALDAWTLAAWVFTVSFLGVWVAWILRPALIVQHPLPYPAGLATLETLRDVFAQGREATARISVLAGSALAAGAWKAAAPLAAWSPSAAAARLTLGLDPSPLLAGFGAIIGLRAALSLGAGAALAWGGIAPWLLATGQVRDGGFGPLVEWLLWPGVALMVAAAGTSFALQLRGARLSIGAQWTPGAVAGLAAACALAVLMQMLLFGIGLWLALLAVPLALVLAAVAARVVGETGIPPIGAIGKVSQLGVGLAAPGEAVTNLMAANVAGGAAGQCADLMNDFKVGHAIGARPARQAAAQVLGVLVGAVTGSVVYLALVPDPAAMLLTAEWPAPAVATWKAVAEAMSEGLSAVPPGARAGVGLGAAAGVALGVLEARTRRAPNGVALGLAFVIPASICFTMLLGALAARAFEARSPKLAARFTIAAAAGLVAGESLVGVGAALAGLAAR
jgi:uncharacterized oligopeptide transporter (OPT) family protein